MKKIFLTTLIALGCMTQPAFALSPTKCPNIHIAPIIFQKAAKGTDADTWNVASEPFSFDTDYNWVMYMTDIHGDNAEDAMHHASGLIRNMHLESGPDRTDQANIWSCSYSDGKHLGFAITK